MRKTVIITAVAGSAAAAAVIWSAVPHGHTDYRDPVQLARAVKDAEHSTSASCGKLPAGKYLCVAANADGSSGTYTVTVAADGKSYTVS